MKNFDAERVEQTLRHARDRKLLDQLLRECQARNDALLAASSETILGIRDDGTCVYSKLSGDFVTPDTALTGRMVTSVLPKQFVDKWLSYSRQATRIGELQSFEFETTDDDRTCTYGVRFVRSSPNECLVLLKNVTRFKQMEDRMRLSHRLEAVGRLAGGIAHDFNNILTVIRGNAQLSLLKGIDDDDNRHCIEEIRDAADSAASLTRQLLAFSRKQVMKPVPLDLNALVRSTEAMLRRLIGEHIDLVSTLDAELDMVAADPAQIEQILINLAINGRDAMPDGGRLIFETENVDVYETYIGQAVEVRSGPYVMLAVSDTGTGMGAEIRSKAFDPFFTTKGPGKGTGLGLAMVYGIVKQSGGYIWLYSEPGIGTTVKIYFPRLNRVHLAAASFRDPNPRCSGKGETILLVEDDPRVLAVGERFLKQSGYDVVATTDVSEALQIAGGHPSEIHLLATDVVMPTMNGTELAAKIAAVRPQIKILYMSGYTDDAIAHHGVVGENVALLQKPYSQTDLLDAVHQALDEGEP